MLEDGGIITELIRELSTAEEKIFEVAQMMEVSPSLVSMSLTHRHPSLTCKSLVVAAVHMLLLTPILHLSWFCTFPTTIIFQIGNGGSPHLLLLNYCQTMFLCERKRLYQASSSSLVCYLVSMMMIVAMSVVVVGRGCCCNHHICKHHLPLWDDLKVVNQTI